MNVLELARRYYPRLWDKARLEALAENGKLTWAEYQTVCGERKDDDDRDETQAHQT